MTRPFLSHRERSALIATLGSAAGAFLAVGCVLLFLSLASHSSGDPWALNATPQRARNALGPGGATVSAHLFAWLGYGAFALLAALSTWSVWLLLGWRTPPRVWRRVVAGAPAVLCVSAFLSGHGGEILPGIGLGGIIGDYAFRILADLLWLDIERVRLIGATLILGPAAFFTLLYALGGRFGLVQSVLSRMASALGEIAALALAYRDHRRRIHESAAGAYPERPKRPPRAPEEGVVAPPLYPPRRVPPAPEQRRVEPSFSLDPRQIGDGAPDAPEIDAPIETPRPRRRVAPDVQPVIGAAPPDDPSDEEGALDAEWRAAEPDAAAPNRGRRRPEKRRRWTIGRAGPGYAPPEVDLLDLGRAAEPDPDVERRLALKAERLQRVLNEYGVRGDVIDVSPGPVVSQFELEPGPGVKVSRVVGLADDIARAMSSVSARVAPIPGKNVIGIELPNAERETVALRRLLQDSKFITHAGALPIALGVDLTGAPVAVDLARAPHLLIAGATGSGKSVAVNAILLSLLYRLDPSELRLLLIDPKMLELSVYNGAPHLLAPVVTDPREALAALKWAVREMERRYELMSKLGVRGVEGYNARAEKLRRAGGLFELETMVGCDPENGEPIVEFERLAPDKMARIVVIIDEMADLMMVAGKEIEHCVLRLAQMGRASGIHLVAATQRPSVDVITGLIKANFPTRISLQTASAADSKTILDRPGAERLLGKGDMLYAPGGGRLERIHGAFVSDDEVAAVAEHLRAQGPAENQISFDRQDQDAPDEAPGHDDEGGDDAYYERAKRIVVAEKRASASFLQRRLSIGYNRASRLIEQMERDGVVSPLTPAGKREVLAPQDAAAAAK